MTVAFLKNVMRKLTGRKTEEEEREERVSYLSGILVKPPEAGTSKTKPTTAKEFISLVAENFTITGISVLKADGTELLSVGSIEPPSPATFRFVKSEVPADTRYLLMKGERYTYIIYKEDDLFYIIRTPGRISGVELQIIAKKLNAGVHEYEDILA
jgi:hypothetical protein